MASVIPPRLGASAGMEFTITQCARHIRQHATVRYHSTRGASPVLCGVALTTTMPSQPSLPTVNRLLSAEFCGAFIDDSGTPGQSSPSEHLHPGRKTWVALVLEAHHLATVYREMPGALSEL